MYKLILLTNSIWDSQGLHKIFEDVNGNVISDFNRSLNENSSFSINISDNTLDKNYIIEPIFLDNEGYIISDIGCKLISTNQEIVGVVDNGDGTFTLTAKKTGKAKILIISNGYGDSDNVKIYEFMVNSSISETLENSSN